MNKEWLERRVAARRSLLTKAAGSGTASNDGICAMIQAACAVVALALAIFAYSSWKSQEAAKRQADVAMEILRNVHSTSQCLRRDLSILAPPSPTNEQIERIARVGLDAMNRCSDDLARLSANALIARTLLDLTTSTALSTLDAWARFRRSLLEALSLLKHTPLPVSASEKPSELADRVKVLTNRRVLEVLRHLGARRLDETWLSLTSKEFKLRLQKENVDRAPDGEPVKPARDELDEYVAGIEALLAKYIHFR